MRSISKRLPDFSAVMAIGLLIQFIVGMVTNLFFSIPIIIPGTQSLSFWPKFWSVLNWSLSYSNPVLEGHSGLGVLLVPLSWFFVFVAHRAKSWRYIVLGWIAALSMLFAAWNGILFLMDGQIALHSLWMALGFVISLAMYGVGLRMK
ncbi:hypothetical protein [Sulfoacidibacillus thermotolerans]|uniref:Uncharacterized protein n=1 Tax=Sulfoacidibacillus thermotolerans TaxID=1765684 RepID=A0A2U3D828_SULT2|nr:hypothetical protein [Sulfoacidibacillus thermotolerans]PWI57430.1 hypothetical protein BM613_08895 [Sulfoacidibacillus thermotolerans]